MLCSRRRKHWQPRGEENIRDQLCKGGLTMAGHLATFRQRCIDSAGRAEARLRRLVNKRGVPPASARNLAALERAKVDGGAPGGHQPNGESRPGSLPVNPDRRSGRSCIIIV